MWQRYHTLRVSDAYKQYWEDFLQQSIYQPASPTFFQFVSHEMFKELVKAKHELPESTKDQPSPITKDDENAYLCKRK